MTIAISLEFLLTLITTIVGGVVWICTKLEKINASIARIHTDFVSHSTCKERRESCPCVQQINTLQKLIDHHEG